VRSLPIVPNVVRQHVEDLASLWDSRRVLTKSGHLSLGQLSRIDRRIAAQEDGCVTSGAQGFELLMERMVDPIPSALFAASVVALEGRNTGGLDRCFTVAENIPEISVGLISALGWVSRDRLAGIGRALLDSSTSLRRRSGFAACRLHAADPGELLPKALHKEDPVVRTEALRLAGVQGRHEFVSTIAAMSHDDPASGFWAAWSAVLLGDRAVALAALTNAGMTSGPERARGFRLAVQVLPVAAAHNLLQSLAREPNDLPWLIRGSGISGDPTYIPWLIGHMSNDQTARLAGEAFSLITGTDLALLDLERRPPENFESGPNDDPDDPNVDMDPDEGLPWPDPDRIKDWWAKNGDRFSPGQRYFMGAPVTREHCIDVLKNGYQRQRILAAHYLCLLDPGTPLFNTSAPAWRQQRLLAEMR
jgi:uncharacterized protein (TIGR02270 family)